MHFCLDTSIIIDIFHGDEILKMKLNALDPVYSISPLVLCELFRGAYLSQKQKEGLTLINEFMKDAHVLSFTEEACKLYGELFSILRKKGMPTQDQDLMIACNAMSYGATLITRNIKHFENIPGLRVIEI